MLKPMFRKHFLLTFSVFVAVLGLCAFLAIFVANFERDRFIRNQATELIAQIQSQQGDKISYVKELNELNIKMHSPIRVQLLPDGAKVDVGNGPNVVQPILIDNQKMNFVLSVLPFPGSPPMGPSFKYPNEHPDNGPSAAFDLPPPPPHGGAPPPPLGPPLISFLLLVVAVSLASALSVVLIYRSFRDKAELAKEILGKMQHGDLKARFPISKWDESSQIFTLYNQMADEIERLVERLRKNEQTRITLLQELAHDLRTPVSSLRNVIETIRFDEQLLDAATKEELKKLALQETEYLSRLVEDLLFLGFVLEPKYRNDSEELSVKDLLAGQLTATASSYPQIKCELSASGLSRQDSLTLGNPHLLRRMFRNALENACSFAKSEVKVTVHRFSGQLIIAIRDDGPGFSNDALASFGKAKSSTRYLAQNSESRPSVGLGSVIIQTIAEAHAGSVSAHNLVNDGKILGAELTIVLRTFLVVAS